MTSEGADGAAYQLTGDKEDLLPGHEGQPTPSVETPTSDGSSGKNEVSPLHKTKKVIQSGKSVAQSHGLRVIVACTVGFTFIITLALILSIYLGTPQVGAHGAVAADVPQCSEVGLNILKQSGTAVDAAIATMFCVGVVNAQSSGIGGGGFMLIHDHKNGKSEVIDFRETAPASANIGMFDGDKLDLAQSSGLAVAVPGELRGMEAAHKKYGSLSWSSLVKPAADIARQGFTMTNSMAQVFDEGKVEITEMKGNLKKYYSYKGAFLSRGSKIKRPDLAATLDIIAENGVEAFYNGELTQGIVDKVNSYGGNLHKDDLKNYKVKVRDVVETTFSGYTVASVPAPGSGPVLLSILNILENYNWTEADANKTQTVHQMIEAFKFAYGQQRGLGDPDFVESVTNVTQTMLSKTEAAKIRSLIDNSTHPDIFYYAGSNPSTGDGGTSHLSVVDSAELMVSVTTTVNTWFGSKIITDSGILLNNEMTDFAVKDSKEGPNSIAPGKRALSNMIPTILYKADRPCSLRLAVGGANGTKIVTGIAETLLNIVSFGLNLTSAIEAPRIHNYLNPNIVEYEAGYDPTVLKGLLRLGHDLVEFPKDISIIQGVKKVEDVIEAHSDSRKGGKAVSFK